MLLLSQFFPINSEKKRIVIDLTHLKAGGENGGAKLMILELIGQIAKLSPEYQIFLLTSSQCHDELSFLDAPNVQRICVIEMGNDFSILEIALKKQAVRIRTSQYILRELKADLLFNPLTEPLFFEASIPSISVIYDLQYVTYPQFFSEEQCKNREQYVKEACRLSHYIICISEYVRQTILDSVHVKPAKVSVIPIRVPDRVELLSSKRVSKILKNFPFYSHEFILYPANFWLHKNHARLFAAFAQHREQYPQSQLKLICTGAPNESMHCLEKKVFDMQLQDWIYFPGYVSDQDSYIEMMDYIVNQIIQNS